MSPQDLALVRRWNDSRDADAFSEIVERYSGLVYGACLRVLKNATDAEDVAQECFMKVAEAASSPTTSLAGWLHTMATRRSLNRLRAEKRRLAREESFGSAHTEGKEYLWDDVQCLIDEAIAGLPDDQRIPLVEHFLLGRSYEAIGEELGVTRQAVSQRVHKGVEQVRSDLRERGIQISSGALPTGLAGLSGIIATEGLRKSLVNAAIGGLDATALAVIAPSAGVWTTALVLGLLAMGGVATYWGMNRGPSQPPNPPAAIAAATRGTTDNSSQPVLVAQATSPQPSASAGAQVTATQTTQTPDFTLASLKRPFPEPGLGAIMVYVDAEDPDGAEATIYNVTWKPWEKVPPTRTIYTQTVTNSRKLVFRNLPLGDYYVKIKQGSRRSNWYANLTEELSSYPLRLPLLGASDVHFDVRNEAGELVPGAEVFAYRSRTMGGDIPFLMSSGARRPLESDEVLIPEVIAGPIAGFVRAPGYAFATTEQFNNRDKPFPVVLTQGATFTCRLVDDATGAPVEGAIVHLQADYFRAFRYGWSDADGNVSIPNIAAGEYELRLHSDSVVLKAEPPKIPIGASGTVEFGDVKVTKGADILGRVYDADTEQGIPNIRLSIESANGTVYEDVVTDAGGQYLMPNASLSRFHIRRHSTAEYGYGAGPRGRTLTVTDASTEGSADFALSKGIPVSGRVLDSNGRGVAGAVIRAAAEKNAMSPQGLSDRNGYFRIFGLKNTTPLFMSAAAVENGTMVQGPFEIPAEGRNDIVLRTTREACVAGTLKIDGRYAPGQTYVFCNPHDPKSETGTYGVPNHYTYTGPLQGKFFLSFLAPGTYDLTVGLQGGGRSPVVATVSVREGEMIENFDINYRTSGLAITGTVADQRGAPVAFAQVSVTGPNSPEMRAQTDTDGAFSLPGLQEGAYQLVLSHAKFSRTDIADVPAPTQGLRVVMRELASVSGSVRSAVTGAPVRQFKVAKFDGQYKSVPTSSTNAKSFSSDTGQFKMDGIDLMGATLVVFADDHAPGAAYVPPVQSGTAQSVTVMLQAPAKLKGRITDEKGKPVAGATIRTGWTFYDPMGGEIVLARTDANGHFETDKLQAGQQNLTASHPDYVTSLVMTTLQFGSTATADVVMKAGGRLTGVVVRANGAPAALVVIRLSKPADTGARSSTTMTDNNGQYVFDRVPAGNYVVQVTELNEEGGFRFEENGSGLPVVIESFGEQILDLGL